jgi:hypothetical protein
MITTMAIHLLPVLMLRMMWMQATIAWLILIMALMMLGDNNTE